MFLKNIYSLGFLLLLYNTDSNQTSWIIDVIVNVLASTVVHRGFKSPSGQTNDYQIGFCCFLSKHTALGRKNKD
jgi:hypothetical protein